MDARRTPTASRRSSRCRPPPAPAPRSAAPASSPIEASHVKKIIFHPAMMPKVAICDPELTVGMPPLITAGTGMDALSHCLEAYCAPGYHPLADGIALEGMRLVKDNLARAVKDGSDLDARAHMMAAAEHGRDRVPEGPRRHPRAVASGRRALRHASRPDQRGVHALRAGVQPQGDRGQDQAARVLSRPARRTSAPFSIGCWRCAPRSACRTRSPD